MSLKPLCKQEGHRGKRVAVSVRQVSDGDAVDVWVWDRHGLDGRTEPFHWIQIRQVRSRCAAQPDLVEGTGASVAGGPGIQEQVGFLHRPIGSVDDPAYLPAGRFLGSDSVGQI